MWSVFTSVSCKMQNRSLEVFMRQRLIHTTSVTNTVPFQANLACVISVVSDSLRPYGLKPTRVLCPWDSPGKNTGVGCLCLPLGTFPPEVLNLNLLRFLTASGFFIVWATWEALMGASKSPILCCFLELESPRKPPSSDL